MEDESENGTESETEGWELRSQHRSKRRHSRKGKQVLTVV